MDEELSKCRRNLLIASSVLIVFELAGANISTIETLGLSVNFKNPEFINYFIWMVMFYELIRFLRLAKSTFTPHETITSKYLRNYKKVTSWLEQSNENYIAVTERYPCIKRKFFTRSILYMENNSGKLGEVELKVSCFFMFFPELICDIKYAVYDSEFVEYTMPYLIAISAMLIPISKFYLEKVSG